MFPSVCHKTVIYRHMFVKTILLEVLDEKIHDSEGHFGLNSDLCAGFVRMRWSTRAERSAHDTWVLYSYSTKFFGAYL